MAKKKVPGLWIDRDALQKHLHTGQTRAPKPIPFPRPAPIDTPKYEIDQGEDRDQLIPYDRRKRKSA